MRAKTIFLMSLGFLLFLSEPSFADTKRITLRAELKGSQSGELRGLFTESGDAIVNATVDDNLILDLEFLLSLDDVTIEIWDNYGNCILNETVDVANGLHIIADLSLSDAWYYEVYIYNDDLNISGAFELE